MSPRHLALLGTLLFLTACKEPPPPARTEARRYSGPPPDGSLHAYFFDVGQGDAALIVSPEGHTVLVDTGPASAANHLVNRLPELLTKPLDLVILTHPHNDHHGALEPVLKRVGARQLMEPQLPKAPDAYDALLTAVSQRGVQVISPAPPTATPNAPQRIALGKDVALTVLWPRAPSDALLESEDASLEVNSIILRLSYGQTSVLLMGDALAQTEEYLLARDVTVQSTLLKVGAHGMARATSAPFLSRVGARAAVISVGANNEFKAPAAATLERLKAAGTQVFRTDVDGEVQVVSDGTVLTVTPQTLPKGAPADTRYTLEGRGPTPEPTVWAGKPLSPPAPPPVVEPPVEAPVAKVEPAPAAASSGKKYKGPFHASRLRQLFHVPECRAAHSIAPKNLVIYKTREEADHANRVPHDCIP